MKIFNSVEAITSDFHHAYITIGNFDGVHIGHRCIFKQVQSEARQAGAKAVVITFDPHPKMILHPERRPFYLIATVEEKMALLEEAGIDAVLLIPFSLDYAKITAQSFVHDILWQRLHVRKIFIGHDYTFGHGKEGNQKFLEEYGQSLGFSTSVINAVKMSGTIISSTLIRHCILDGDVRQAMAFLGRPYNIKGIVAKGYGRGNNLGFPTANLEPEKVLLPKEGVYAAWVILENRRFDAVLNIGCNPTFSNDHLTIEVHLLDFREELYGKSLQVYFVDRLRGEIKFTTPEALASQIGQDAALAKKLLNQASQNDPPLYFA
ncbi:MAG: bifunctional riboflavin kinase/FAD synthetase [Syntrophobacterales bacterium]|jgi:riboflavin kinase/FMN adenylyltransferase|nr:bifunctional riboflavin kinase/FAD synthetase [Syntrophobacterales bacterium]